MNIPTVDIRSDKLLACRICLACDEKLYNITESGLRQMFMDVLGTSLSEFDGLPQHLCIVCRALLLKASALRARTRRADAVLKQALVYQQSITNTFITTIDRSAHKLTYNLKRNNLTTTLEIQHKAPEVTVIKEEVDFEDAFIDYVLDNDTMDVKPENNFAWPQNDYSNELEIGDTIVGSANIVDAEIVKPLKNKDINKNSALIENNELAWTQDDNNINDLQIGDIIVASANIVDAEAVKPSNNKDTKKRSPRIKNNDLAWPQDDDSNELQIGDNIVAPANIVDAEIVKPLKNKDTNKNSALIENNDLAWPQDDNNINELQIGDIIAASANIVDAEAVKPSKNKDTKKRSPRIKNNDLAWPQDDDSNVLQIDDNIVAPVNRVDAETVKPSKNKDNRRSARIKNNDVAWPQYIIDSNVFDVSVVVTKMEEEDLEKFFKKDTKKTDTKVVNKKHKLTKKSKFSTQEYIKEFEEKYEFDVKWLTEEEMVEDMETRKQSKKYVEGEYKCELCFRGFFTASAYDKHVKDKHDPNIGPNECHLCHARYRFAVNRNQHIQDAHRIQFSCRRCYQVVSIEVVWFRRGPIHRRAGLARCGCQWPVSPLMYNVWYQAVEHAASHTGATVKCRHCDKRFTKKTTCASHMRLDHPAENAAGGTCEVCGETFISRTGLNCHKTRAHNKPYNKKLHCRKCRIQFDNMEALQRHKINRPDNKCQPHGSVCCACGEWCADTDDLVLHKHNQHGTALFTCDECSKSFLSKLSLATHLDRVHRGVRAVRPPPRPRPRPGAVCETCGKTFQCLALLKLHQFRHLGLKPHKCELCPKAYGTANELNVHRVSHTGEKPFKCERCSKCYATAAALKVHMEAIHIRQRHYRCIHCPKTFMRATALNVHKVVHTGEKRFECALCGAKFTQGGSLATHRKNVHLKLTPPKRRRGKQNKTS